ncbi:group II intron reverse transcriptase/maturase [Chitinophaga oryziterrae]|uniref:Group II intron reverse transcriptase/maturase n=2 Tax=Chitinophaga oryziterrae TaxID=1031224 RepID=A0A6N8JG82_9BACT|nr:group II intron reverse transcriptase/maturase [Chitinophaga oryziterrae]
MIKTSITLQELRKKIYIKAKADKSHRFWGLYVHICKMETLEEAYRLAKANNGAHGLDKITFDDIEQTGRQQFLQNIHEDLINDSYQPQRNRIVEIPKANGKTRKLGIANIRDRVVQVATKLILEPVFEADFQDGSYGYRPKRTAHQAIERVAQAIVNAKTRVIDLDLRAYFDTVKHHILLRKVAERVSDEKILRLLKQMLKAGGKEGVPQGSGLSPLLSNIYLNEVDKMLEKAKEATREGKYTHIEYTRFADDAVILVDEHQRYDWLWEGIRKRLFEELNKLKVEINEEKTKFLDLNKGESFGFLGFDFRKVKSLTGKWRANYQPKMQARLNLMGKIRDVFKRLESQPLTRVRDIINPILRGWVQYFRVGHSSKTFGYIKDWLTRKIRRHLKKAKRLKGFGWNLWSTKGLYAIYNIYSDFNISPRKVSPTR